MGRSNGKRKFNVVKKTAKPLISYFEVISYVEVQTQHHTPNTKPPKLTTTAPQHSHTTAQQLEIDIARHRKQTTYLIVGRERRQRQNKWRYSHIHTRHGHTTGFSLFCVCFFWFRSLF